VIFEPVLLKRNREKADEHLRFTVHNSWSTGHCLLVITSCFPGCPAITGAKGQKKNRLRMRSLFLKENISTGLVDATVAMARNRIGIGTRSGYDDKTDCCCCQSGQRGGAEAYASGSGRGSSDGNTSGAGAGGSSCAGAASCGCLIGCHAHGCTDQQYTANDHYRNNLFHSVSSP
jgi:hypothetical protein